MANKPIDEVLKKYGESAEVRRQNVPHREEPTHYQKQKEKASESQWSGASAGGGVWAGRGR